MPMRLLIVSLLALLLALPCSPGAVLSGTRACNGTLTATALSTNTSVRAVTITMRAPNANAGTVFVGGSNVNTTNGGVFLESGDSFTLQPQGNSASYTLSQVYFACTNSADDLDFAYAQ